MTFASSLALLAVLALASLLVGRLFIGGFGTGLFRHFDPAGAAAALAIGTAVLTLVCTWLSASGLSAPTMLPLIAALQVVPLALSWRRGRLDVLRPSGPANAWLSLAAPIATTALLALLPLHLTNGFAAGNDTYTYSAFSEWLQHHGFSEAGRDACSPVTVIPALYQDMHYDLGVAHWLALAQAAARAPSALLVYPATATFGMVLLVSMVWLLLRQVLRLGLLPAGATALLSAAAPHALYWGHHNGFLAQAYAVPVLLFGLGLLVRGLQPGRWDPACAALVALPIAYLISSYNPLLPTLLLAAVPALAAAYARARRRGGRLACVGFVVLVALFAGLFAARYAPTMLAQARFYAATVVGGHVPFSPLESLQFALSTRVLPPAWTSVDIDPWSGANRLLTPVYLALAMVGLGRAWRLPRGRPLAAATSVFIAGIGYFAIWVADPWTGRSGHTWNVFKLTQWISPFVFMLGALGLQQLTARMRKARLAVRMLVWVMPMTLVVVHWPWSHQLGGTMQDLLPGPSPLTDLPALKQRIQDLPPGTLMIVGRPSNGGPWLGSVASLLTYPRHVVADWHGSASVDDSSPRGAELYDSALSHLDLDSPGIVPILAGFVPFQTEGIEPLGGGFARLLPGHSPVILHVMEPSGLERKSTEPRGPAFEITEGRTKIVILTRDRNPVELRLTLRPYPDRIGSWLEVYETKGDFDHRAVRQATEMAPQLSVELDGRTALRVPLKAAVGLRTVVLVVRDRGVLSASAPALTVLGLRLNPSAPDTANPN